jgi:hypothetical protein
MSQGIARIAAAAILFGWTLLVLPTGSQAVGADDELRAAASWTIPTADDVRSQVDAWLAERSIDDATRDRIEAIWAAPAERETASDGDLLERFAVTVSLVDARFVEVVALCRTVPAATSVRQFDVLDDESLSPLVRSNLRLYYGRWLAQHAFYDESLELLTGLAPEDVIDPTSLLFYQSVAHHRLLDKEKCLPTLARLMENEPELPRRYKTVAKLMEADLKPLETDSLDEIARLMQDVQRRLGFGRAGQVVRKQEDDVIAKLDKLIEQIEQQQQQQQQSSGNSGSMNPSTPMQDSNPGGQRGPGNVDPRRIGNGSGWGDLPAREREAALQEISKDLPSHYRDVIEAYFRRIAREGSP